MIDVLDYRVRWKVDDNGDLKKWETPQLLGVTKFFGFNSISAVRPFIASDEIVGTVFHFLGTYGEFVLKK